MALHELHTQPTLEAPVLLVGLEGWIDAGTAAAIAVSTIKEQSEPQLVATFDRDALLDFRARRPTLHLVDGVNTGLTWPATELYSLQSPDGTDVLLLTGAEPDHSWGAFCADIVTLTLEFGVRMQVGLGAYPAATPHTRPVLLSATASDETMAESLGFVRGTVDVPAGLEAVLERAYAEAGLPAVGVWAQVPHYLAGMSYPAAASRLLDGLNQVAGTEFRTDSLAADIAANRERIDSLVTANPQHVAMLRQMEAGYDAETEQRMEDLPSGDDLAAEVQRFLREQGDS